MGAQIDMVSKAGSNDLHASVFEFLRNDKFDSRSPFDGSTLPPFRLNQFGASLGGRIVKDRTFFFMTSEGLRQRRGQTLIGLCSPIGWFLASWRLRYREFAPRFSGSV